MRFVEMALPINLLRACSKCVSTRIGSVTSTDMTVKSRALFPVTLLQHKYSYYYYQKRNHTIIMERVYPLPAGKDGGLPKSDQCNELHKILKHVKIVNYPSELECILTDYVEGIGIRGDVVNVKRSFFHNELFPSGLAVYASPENIEEFEEERKAKGIEKAESRLGVLARMAMKELNHMHLNIPMNENTTWTLTKQHAVVAFRKQGIELAEDCLQLPEDAITDFVDLSIDVWINGLESVSVKATIIPISEEFPQKK